MTSIRLFPILIAGTLSACMGSGNDDNPVDTGTGIGFAELGTLNQTLIDEITDAGPTPLAEIPTMGGATYNGTLLLGLQDGSEDGVIGQMEITANFVDKQLTGEASNFYDLEGDATAGTLSFENVVYETTLTGLITGDASGTVDFQAGEMDIAAVVVGNFSGDAATYVSGIMSGSATPDGAAGIALIGGFYAKQ